MYTIYRIKTVLEETGFSRSGLYEAIAAGLFVKPVHLSERARGWPGDEVHTLNAARISGMSPEKLRQLVEKLHADREKLAKVAV